jgi:hypothetical protein
MKALISWSVGSRGDEEEHYVEAPSYMKEGDLVYDRLGREFRIKGGRTTISMGCDHHYITYELQKTGNKVFMRKPRFKEGLEVNVYMGYYEKLGKYFDNFRVGVWGKFVVSERISEDFYAVNFYPWLPYNKTVTDASPWELRDVSEGVVHVDEIYPSEDTRARVSRSRWVDPKSLVKIS